MAAVPTRATFVIYKDEPSSPTSADSVAADAAAPTTTLLAVVTAGDKENLHPATGRRPTPEEVSGKKRKTGALATKLLIASGKAIPEPHPTPKKRKLSTSSGANRSVEKKEPKREKRATSTARKSKAKAPARVRKATELPKVEEEVQEEEAALREKPEQTGTEAVQAAVDAKCYDLTVLPLADVSKAFEQSPLPEEELVEEEEEEPSEDKVRFAHRYIESSLLRCAHSRNLGRRSCHGGRRAGPPVSYRNSEQTQAHRLFDPGAQAHLFCVYVCITVTRREAIYLVARVKC